MASRQFAVALAGTLILLSAPATADAGEGFIHHKSSGPTILRTAAKLNVGDKLVVQYRKRGQKSRCCVDAVVVADISALPSEGDATNVVDLLGDTEVLTYTLKLAKPGKFDGLSLGAAIFAPSTAVRQLSPERLQIGTGAKAKTVDICLSQEGLHLITHKGDKVSNHLYWGFSDYSVKPTCSRAVGRLIDKPKR